MQQRQDASCDAGASPRSMYLRQHITGLRPPSLADDSTVQLLLGLIPSSCVCNQRVTVLQPSGLCTRPHGRHGPAAVPLLLLHCTHCL